jgi:hypothetical protein
MSEAGRNETNALKIPIFFVKIHQNWHFSCKFKHKCKNHSDGDSVSAQYVLKSKSWNLRKNISSYTSKHEGEMI